MKKHNGFTLVELIIVVAIIGIVMMVAAPSMRAYISNSRAATIKDAILIDIMYARNHAITNEVIVKITPHGTDPQAVDSADSLASLFEPNASGVNWGLGWRMFVDTNNDNSYNADEITLRNQPSFGPGAHISSGPGAHIGLGPDNLLDRVNPIGFNPTGTSIRQGVLSIAAFGCAGDNARILQINQIGQVISRDTDCPTAFTDL
jgi:prepilin-type N-terminal cleavage/methylation domain-containing protein